MSIKKPKPSKNETKRDRFRRLAQRRTGMVINRLRILGNCADKGRYEYTKEDMERIFIAIDLPPQLKEGIAGLITQWRWLPIRWLPRENWHVTLVPPMYLEDEEVRSLVLLLEGAKLGKPFPIRFSEVSLAPPGLAARMIWLEGETPPELAATKKKLENLLIGKPHFFPVSREARPYKLHVTLARFEPGDLKELQERTRVLGNAKMSFTADEVVLMESHLKPTGAEYEKIATVAL